jgi:hypothetical protein
VTFPSPITFRRWLVLQGDHRFRAHDGSACPLACFLNETSDGQNRYEVGKATYYEGDGMGTISFSSPLPDWAREFVYHVDRKATAPGSVVRAGEALSVLDHVTDRLAEESQ